LRRALDHGDGGRALGELDEVHQVQGELAPPRVARRLHQVQQRRDAAAGVEAPEHAQLCVGVGALHRAVLARPRAPSPRRRVHGGDGRVVIVKTD
jgi:hypothetical protein